MTQVNWVEFTIEGTIGLDNTADGDNDQELLEIANLVIDNLKARINGPRFRAVIKVSAGDLTKEDHSLNVVEY